MNWLVSEITAQTQAGTAPLRHLPFSSWSLIVLVSLLVWPGMNLAWLILRWMRDLIRPDSSKRELTIRASDDGYIMLGQWNAPWIGGSNQGQELESKKTALYIRCGKKTAKGTVRYSHAKDMVDDVLGIPQDVADKLGLRLEPAPIRANVSVRVARRFPIENLWNNADQSIKLSFRTAVWIAAITTVISLGTPVVFGHL